MRKRIGSVALAVAIGFGGLGAAFASALVTAAPAGASGPVVYSAVPGSIPPNVPSIGFEATQAAEFGDEVGLVSNATPLAQARVLMSSWGCESGTWFNNNCATTPGATFSVPITFKIYAVNAGSPPTPGALLGSRTQTFAIPFRPSASAACTNADAGKWYSGGTCYNGLATPITFNFTTGPQVNLPSQVIWTVTYNTTHYGPNPIGESTACFGTSAGCGYDSLNVGLASTNSVGTDTDPDGLFWNTATAGNYCDGGTGGTGTLRDDTPCWTGYVPAGELQLATPPPPPTVPGAPRNVTSSPGNGKATVHWLAPTSNGGSAINGYAVTPVINGVAQPVQTFNSPATTEVISGLKNGVTYKFRVAARNAVGTGAATATPSGVTVGAPGAPSMPSVSHPASGSLKLTFKAPATNGAPITGYTAQCVSNNGSVTQKGNGTTITVSGLTAGQKYACSVRATNSRGTGPSSARTAPMTA